MVDTALICHHRVTSRDLTRPFCRRRNATTQRREPLCGTHCRIVSYARRFLSSPDGAIDSYTRACVRTHEIAASLAIPNRHLLRCIYRGLVSLARPLPGDACPTRRAWDDLSGRVGSGRVGSGRVGSGRVGSPSCATLTRRSSSVAWFYFISDTWDQMWTSRCDATPQCIVVIVVSTVVLVVLVVNDAKYYVLRTTYYVPRTTYHVLRLRTTSRAAASHTLRCSANAAAAAAVFSRLGHLPLSVSRDGRSLPIVTTNAVGASQIFSRRRRRRRFSQCCLVHAIVHLFFAFLSLRRLRSEASCVACVVTFCRTT